MNALPWYGGKVLKRQWINELLGGNRRWYSEPFFGMGAVLLARKPSSMEIVSDLNGRVVNWWRQVQTRPRELAEIVRAIPYSRAEYLRYCKRIDEGSALERAAAFTVVVYQTRTAADGAIGNWANSGSQAWLDLGYADRLERLAYRIRRLQIDNRCATRLMRRLAKKKVSDYLMYVDPPYWGEANVVPYSVNEPLDLTDLLLAQRGRVAVSGYGSMFDHLGWTRHEKKFANMIGQTAPGNERTEVLWLNDR